MIASVRGEVLVRRPDHVVVESAGVGYRLTVSAETLKAVPASGKEIMLHSHLVVRDDSMQLFGFASEEERDLFLHLTSVSGVGPKVADRDPLRRHAARAAAGDRRRRREALPGRARDRQADLGAGDRRAAREGRRRARGGRADDRRRARRRSALARPRRARRARLHGRRGREAARVGGGRDPRGADRIGPARRRQRTRREHREGSQLRRGKRPDGGLDDPIAPSRSPRLAPGATTSSTARCAPRRLASSSTRSR